MIYSTYKEDRYMGANNDLGMTLKQRRLLKSLTLSDLARESGVSPSYLGRVERGERSPSALILRKVSRPLGFDETELLILADYMAPPTGEPRKAHLDPYVAAVLSQEPVEVQRTVVNLLAIFKALAESREARRE